MFEGVDPIAQIIIALSILVGVIVIFIISYKRGIRVGVNKNYVQLGSNKESNGFLYLSDLEIIIDIIVENVESAFELNRSVRLERKMEHAQTMIIELRGLKEQRFYRLLKDAGIKQDNLTSHPDAQYYIQVLGNALYYDNGTQSLVSAVRSALRKAEYSDIMDMTESENRERREQFIESFVNAINQRWKRFFYDNYKTDVIDDDGRPRKRVVTNEDIYESDFEQEHVKEIKEIFRNIFKNAIVIDKQIAKEQSKLEKKRKEKTEQIIKLRRGEKDETDKA